MLLDESQLILALNWRLKRIIVAMYLMQLPQLELVVGYRLMVKKTELTVKEMTEATAEGA